MTAKPPPREILVIATQESDRQRIESDFAEDFHVRSLPPEGLRESAPWVDACGAIAVLQGSDGDILEDLMRLQALPAGRALVLILRDLGDEQLEHALSHLSPAQVLTDPTPALALRFALDNALPADTSGRGARPNQRRAPALLGVSQAIREVMDQIRRIAPSSISVLILGETGTGKELVARAVHEQSPRAGQPFVAVNCAALPDSLLESELFGYERGAFTGAERDMRGLFEQADGGTLFLDEVGDTSPALQVKLLRVIETREVRPLGGSATRPVDVRIVSATHRDLETAIADNAFRQDLLYRLNTVTVQIPPLRRRRVDVPFLAQHFAEEFGDEQARRIVLDEGFFDALAVHDFPGNVRELRNAVERTIAMAKRDETITAAHLALAQGQSPGVVVPPAGTLRERLDQVEFEVIRQSLAEHDGNRTRTAQALGLSRVGLRQKMRRLGLEDSSS